MKTRYFEVKPLKSKYPHARYYYILGGRSTGKTYPTIKEALEDAIKGRGLFAYVRRYKESLQEVFMATLFRVHDKTVEKLTGGEWNRVVYHRRRIWLEKWELNEEGMMIKVARNPQPIGITCCLSTWETEKGGDFGYVEGIKNIILDEALSKAGQYLKDEWTIFQNVISTLVRDRWEFDTKIWLLANPISKWANPYFRNMGITKKMISRFGITEIKYPNEKGGTAMTAIFAYLGNDIGTVSENANKVNETFFAFEYSKGKSKSITHGYWEMEDSARLPSGVYRDSTKHRTVYALFGEEKLAIDIMRYDNEGKYYLMIYPANDIRPKSYYLILGTSLDRYAVIGCDEKHPITRLVFAIYRTGQVYYSDDSTADAWHGFLTERTRYKV